MVDAAHLLETLHALREPPAPAPVVPLILGAVAGCLAAGTAVVAAWRLRHRHAALRRAATAALAASRRLAPGERLAAQARLLRRLARGVLGEAAAREQGDAWLARLDALFGTRFFTQGAGAAYGDALYRRPLEADVDALDRSLLDLFGKLPTARGSR